MCSLLVVFVDNFGRSNDEMIQKACNLALTLFSVCNPRFQFFVTQHIFVASSDLGRYNDFQYEVSSPNWTKNLDWYLLHI